MTPSPSSQSLTVFAPAKINLFLHVINRRHDGYHNLQSLVTFADIGDTVTLSTACITKFEINGPFSNAFDPKETDSGPQSKNIMMKALWGLSSLYNNPTPQFQITLHKELPLSSGIGGGSADAAALIWGITKLWGMPDNKDAFEKFMLDLGADVPVCFRSNNALVEGIGEKIFYTELIPEIPVVFINPLKPCPTTAVFKSFQGKFHRPIAINEADFTDYNFIDFLKKHDNALEEAAQRIVPDITNVLNTLNYSDGCRLARMSGSGATCFGLFDDENKSQKASQEISIQNPDWWVKAGKIGQAARY